MLPSITARHLFFLLGTDDAAKRRTVANLVPAWRHDLDRKGRVRQRRGHVAVVELAAGPAHGRQEDLEPAQAAARLTRQGVQGLELAPPGEGVAAEAVVGVQGQAEICGWRSAGGLCFVVLRWSCWVLWGSFSFFLCRLTSDVWERLPQRLVCPLGRSAVVNAASVGQETQVSSHDLRRSCQHSIFFEDRQTPQGSEEQLWDS